jgi:hypothetical protein
MAALLAERGAFRRLADDEVLHRETRNFTDSARTTGCRRRVAKGRDDGRLPPERDPPEITRDP